MEEKNRLNFKNLTTTCDIASLVGIGGLSTISCFVIFFQEYAIHISIARFILSIRNVISKTNRNIRQNGID